MLSCPHTSHSYLALSAAKQMEREAELDEETLETVINMGFRRDTVLAALEMGDELLTSRELAHYQE